VLNFLVDLVTDSPWTYAIIFGVAALDAFFPVVPSETIVITAGVLAAQGKLHVWSVFPAAALGSFLGDNISFALGRYVGEPIAARLFSSGKARERLDWASEQLRERGPTLIVAGRFVPGGRTAVTFSAGTVGYSWRRFVAADAAAAILWGAYGTGIGYFGGTAFENNTGFALLLAFGIAVVAAVTIEGVRRLRARSTRAG
jgi:membrane protein DedA with SNARE-associated domain